MMEVSRNVKKTMHSSRMRTARLLPVSPSMHCSRVVPTGGGVYLVQGGVPGPGGCTWSGGCVYLVGGVPVPGVYLVPGGVPGLGGCVYLVGGCTWSGGCTWPGGTCPGGCTCMGGTPAQVLPPV